MSIKTGIELQYDDLKEAYELAQRLDQLLANLGKGYSIKFNQSGLNSTQRQLSSIEQQAVRVERAFRNAGEAVSSVGRGMQALGNAFGGKVIGTMKTMTTAFATMGMYSAAQGTVQRYDTMKIFPKMMEHLGYSAKDATAAVTKLEDAVIGLPTGLDEIVESARQLIPLTGSLKKGTDLAIAVNNAFLAGGADANATRYGQRQIKDLLAKGTLRSQEWDSLFTALGSGLGVIAEEMGYSSKARKGSTAINDQLKYAESRLKSLRNTRKRLEKEGGTAKQVQKNAKAIKVWEKEYDRLTKKQDKSLGSFRNALKTNQISALDFLAALEKVGTGEGELAKRADDYKETISASARNIKNALQKLGAAGLTALDDVLTEKTGKGIPGTIREVSDAIKQNLVPALENWIAANGDDIVDFFNNLKNYDWGTLIGKVGNGLAQYYKLITGFFTKLSPKVIAFLSVWAGPVGRLVQMAGSTLVGVGKFASTAIRIFGKAKPLEDAAEGAASFSRFTGSLKHAFAGLGLAAGMTVEVALIGGVIYEYAKVLSAISNMNFGPNLGKNMSAIADVGKDVTTLATGMTLLFTGMASIPELGIAAAGGELLVTGFIGIVAQIGNVIKEYAKIINYIAGMNIPTESKMENIGKTISSLNDNVLKKVKKVPNRKVTYLSRLSEMAEYVAEVAASLKKIQAVGLIGDISKYVDDIGKGVDAVLDLNYDKSDEKRAKTESKTLKNIASAANSISKISQSLIDMQANVTTLFKRGDATTINNLTSGIAKILDSIGAALKVMQFRSREFATAKENTAIVSEAVVSISTIVSTLVSSQKNISSLISSDHGHQGTTFGSDLITILDSLVNMLGKYQFKTGEYERANKNMDSFAKATASISKIVDSLILVKDSINKIGNSDRDDGMIVKITIILGRVKAIMDIINGMNLDDGGSAKDKMSSVSGAINQLATIIPKLVEIKGQIDTLGVGTDGSWDLGSKIKTIMDNLKSAFGAADGEQTNLLQGGALDSMVSNLQVIVELLATLGENADTVAKNTESAAKKIGDLGKAAADNKGKIQDVATAIGELKRNIQGISSGGSGAASGINALGNAASDNIGAIGLAASAAARLAAAIKSIPSYKSINIQAGGSSIGWARQNIPGFASGGEVHGPSGIDRVRSWLTAGEFVMTKRAHGAFGTSFMNSINNLDVDGAIRALSIRAGAGMRRGGMVTNNYSRDSHSNFTFNINRASQGFTQRRASKWARAFS